MLHETSSPFSGSPTPNAQPAGPFRRAVLRGLGVVLPPLLTIVIFVWVGNTVVVYLLEPLEEAARRALLLKHADIRDNLAPVNPRDGTAVFGDTVYKQTADEKFVPLQVYRTVKENLGTEPMPATALGVYRKYVGITYLKRYIVVPIFLCLFVLLLYLLGKFLAAGIGDFFWTRFERIIHRLPIIRNVYSSVKQVTDFMFSEREVQYTRIVAVEYPRKGIWSLGMVTGDGLLDISSAANEPMVSLLIPTSPMPFTGFTILAKKSEILDLNITFDQAIQFIVSCGVVVPPQQLCQAIAGDTEPSRLPEGKTSAGGSLRPSSNS